MNYRELLEFAAKAIGKKIEQFFCKRYIIRDVDGQPVYWNPLTDDGDALRLAVKLGLLVYVMADAGFTAIRLPGEQIGGKYDEVEMHGSDPYSATRRAIVRAAAEIGKAMP